MTARRKKNRSPKQSDPADPTVTQSLADPADDATSNEPSSPTRWGINWKWVDWSVRCGLVLLMGALFFGMAGQILMPGLFEIGSTPASSSDDEVSNRIEADEISGAAPELFLGDFLNGSWILGQSKWQFGSQDITEMPDESYFAELPPRIRSRDPEFDDKKIVDLFQAFSASQKPVDPFTYWRVGAMGIEAAMFTSESPEGPVVQTLKAVFNADGKITLVTGSPSEFAFADETPTSLLPMCEGVKQLAIRTNDQGIATSAILELTVERQNLTRFWREQGWEVFPSQRLHAVNEQFQCRRGNEQIVVTFMNAGGQNTALAVRIPAAGR